MSIIAIVVLSVSTIPGGGSLTGQVMDESGAPISGAIVDIYTAKPRVGVAVTCPSCYRDCAKTAKTDEQGQFSIVDLDPSLLFRVLVMAPKRRATLTKLIDPSDAPIEVKLSSLPAEVPPNRMLRGQVLDEREQPLAGAVVSPTGAKTRESRWWGSLPGVDEAAVTDAEGRFVITSKDPKLGLDLRVSSPEYAIFPSQLFDLDGTEHVIRMRRGAIVTGRLIYEGKPVARRSIGMVQRDRSAGQFVGETTLATNDDGGFVFTALQPNEDYVLYSLCDASQELPVLKTVSIKTGGDGAVSSLEDVVLLPGLTLAGRVQLPDGAVMPSGAKLRVSRDPAWDWCEVLMSTDGEFTIPALPPEVYSVHVTAPGFEIDASRLRYQVTGESAFALRLRANVERVTRITIPMKSR